MKDDLHKYISRRKKCDGKFAERFESGYQELKVGAFATRPKTPLAVENSVGKAGSQSGAQCQHGKERVANSHPPIRPRSTLKS